MIYKNKLIKSAAVFLFVMLILNLFLIYHHFYPCMDNCAIMGIIGCVFVLIIPISLMIYDASDNLPLF